VTRVRQQRQRVRNHARHDLADHEAEDKHERNRQRPAVCY
jgi:hypothetical protein